MLYLEDWPEDAASDICCVLFTQNDHDNTALADLHVIIISNVRNGPERAFFAVCLDFNYS